MAEELGEGVSERGDEELDMASVAEEEEDSSSATARETMRAARRERRAPRGARKPAEGATFAERAAADMLAQI